MPISIIANQGAQLARASLAERSENVTASTQRLASGQRVKSASEDAAAAALGSGLKIDLAAFRQAQINTGQGLAMMQVADGAITQVGDIITRMKALGVQAASSELSSTERAMLDAEFQSLLTEIDRIAYDTKFNGDSLIIGDTVTASDVNGMGADNVLTAGNGFSGFSFANGFGDGAVLVDYVAATRTMTATDLETGTSQSVVLPDTTISVGSTETVRFGSLAGLEVTLDSNFDKTSNITSTNTAAATGTGAITAGTISLSAVTLDATNPFNFGDADDATITINPAVPASADFSITLNGTVFSDTSVDLSGTGTVTADLTDANGNVITIQFDVGTAFDGAETGVSMELKQLGQVVAGVATAQSSKAFTIQVGTGIEDADAVSFSLQSLTAADLGLASADVTTVLDAKSSILLLDAALATLSTARSNIGAVQSRLDFTNLALANILESNATALANVLDVDVSQEITNLTSEQTLMEAAISMLSQSNERTRLLLDLIR